MDSFNGGAGDDTFAAIMATASTYNVGDSINGGAGTDTLNIIDVSGTAASVVSLDGVEIVNVRSLVGTGTDVTELDASDWDGVTKLTNASSIAGSELQVSGLSISTNVNLVGNTDISIDFSNTTTANAAATLVGAGSFAGVTTYGVTGVTSNATAHLNLDATAAGRVSAIAIELSGNNLANIEAGANVEVYTITGNGSAVLFTDDTLISVDASGYAGSLDITLSGVSDVVAKGGAGVDKFRFGDTYNNNDSINGGAGNDTVALTLGAFGRTLNATNVEAVILNAGVASAGSLEFSTTDGVASVTLLASAADSDIGVSGIDSNTVISLAAANLDQVTIDGASATSVTLRIGTAIGSSTASVAVSGVSVTDVSAIILDAVSGSAGTTFAFGSAIFDADAKSITVNNAGDANVTIAMISANAATSLSIVNSGSGDVTVSSALEANTGLAAVSIVSNGGTGGDVAIGMLGGSGSSDNFASLTVDAQNGSDVTVTSVTLGNAATTGQTTSTIVLSAGSDSIVGSTSQFADAAATANAFDITVTGADKLSLSLDASQSGSISLGTITLGSGAATAGLALNLQNISAATAANISIEGINILGSGGQVSIAAITVAKDANVELAGSAAMGASANNIDIGDITVVVGNSAYFGFENGIDLMDGATAGAIGNISLTIGDGASAAFGAISASGVGTITLSVSGSGAIDFGAINATASVGNISIRGDADADVTFASVEAASLGTIEISGGLDVTFGRVSAASIGAISNVAQTSGTFTINLADVGGSFTIDLGAGTNNVTSSDNGRNTINLRSAAGTDRIIYESAGALYDEVNNFQSGSGVTTLDQIKIDLAAFGVTLTDGLGSAFAAGTGIFATANNTASWAMGASANIIFVTGAFSTTADVASAIKAYGDLGTAAVASDDYITVVWNDGSDTYVSVALIDGSAGATTLASAVSVTITDMTIVRLNGLTAADLAAGNFVFI